MRSLLWLGAVALPAASVLSSMPVHASSGGTYIVVYGSAAAVDAGALSAYGTVVQDLSAAGVMVVQSSNPAGLQSISGVISVGQEGSHFRTPAAASYSEPDLVDEPSSGTACADAGHSCPLQWDLARMQVPEAWERTRGSASVKVAVLDSGVYEKNVEVGSNYDEAQSRSFVQPTSDCPSDAHSYSSLDDFVGHGTWVATHIGGVDGPVMTGIAPDTTYVNVRVLGSCGTGNDSWIMSGMMYANRIGAQVINLSLATELCSAVISGSFYCSDPASVQSDIADWNAMAAVAKYVTAHGSLVIAAADNLHALMDSHGVVSGNGLAVQGVLANDPSNDVAGLRVAPAGLPGVLSVGGTNRVTGGPGATKFGQYGVGRHDQLAVYSDYGAGVDVAAPGGTRNFNVPAFDCGSADCARLGPSQAGANDNTGDFGAFLPGPNSPCKSAPKCFAYLEGTSMANAQVSGVAALVLAAHPSFTPGEVADRLVDSASAFRDGNRTPGVTTNPALPTYNYDIDYGGSPIANSAMGAGVVDAAAAVS